MLNDTLRKNLGHLETYTIVIAGFSTSLELAKSKSKIRQNTEKCLSVVLRDIYHLLQCGLYHERI